MAYYPRSNKRDQTPTHNGILSWDNTNNKHESDAAFPFISGNLVSNQEAPTAETDTVTLTIAELLTGIIAGTPTAAAAYTLPTGTLIDVAVDCVINGSFDWAVINLDATYAITITAGTGNTVVGNMVVAVSSSAQFRTRKTAANTFVTYRLA